MSGGVAEKYADLRTMSDDDLIRAHDDTAGHTMVGPTYYLDELRRRHAAEQMTALLTIASRLEEASREAARQTAALIAISERLEKTSAESSRRLERGTWILVALTILLILLTIALLLKKGG